MVPSVGTPEGPFRSDAEWFYIVDNSNDLP